MFPELLDAAQTLCESLNEEADEILSDIYYTRGAEATETNKKDVALEINLAFLEARLRISKTSEAGSKDPKLAQAYNQAANARLDQGQIDSAIQLYNQALDIFHILDADDETKRTITIANLGTGLWLQHEYEEVHDLLLKNLLARQRVHGTDDTESFRREYTYPSQVALALITY